MPVYKLTYFDARGRAEQIRMMLGLKGREFEDVRITYGGEEWPKIKGDKTRFPFGKMPVLEIDGRVMPECRVISRYLARELGFYGKNTEEDTEIDMILEIIGDIMIAYEKFEEQDVATRAQNMIKARDNELKLMLEFLSDSIRKSGGKYYVGDRITLADMMVFNLVDMLLDNPEAIEGYFDGYPELLKFYRTFKTDPSISSYLKSRPKTEY